MISSNRILTGEELNDVSGGRTNGDNPFVQTVLDHVGQQGDGVGELLSAGGSCRPMSPPKHPLCY
jgi:hypothetical protein